MKSSVWLGFRAVVAVCLMIGFYMLAVALALALAAIPVAEVVFAERIHVQLALFCIIGSFVIFAAILPRPDRFVPPGPLLSPNDHPKLFNEITRVAQATNQAMPAEVYLLLDPNAWVAQRGGIMGYGTRRVMGLGLPLLAVLNVSELRAVLAHEFGHYHAGDTKVGPWVHKTRAALGRAIEGLGQHSGFLQRPFIWYGKLFLRITQAVSRHQEYIADQLAAMVAGANSLITGLRKCHAAGLAYQTYWSDEVVPVFSSGHRPPFAAGFQCFMSAPRIREATERACDQELKDGKADPYDSHPPLRDRTNALKSVVTQPSEEPDTTPALALLSEEMRGDLEIGVLAQVTDEIKLRMLRPVTWETAGETVYAPSWKKVVQEQAAMLKGIKATTLPATNEQIVTLSQKVKSPEGEKLNDEQRLRIAVFTLGAALAVRLQDRGWKLSALPGEPVLLRRDDGAEVAPLDIVREVASGKPPREAWAQRCADLEIADLELS
jgi:Zn-dependent protease with chaperone function